ncbi:MAG: MFS transporter, partial [Alphaproteobacteria bacterium]
AYLGEHFGARDAAGLFAACITGNVASNLVGRMVSAAAVDHLGIAGNFELFAALNLAGALLARLCLDRAPPMDELAGVRLSPLAAWRAHLSEPGLRASFAIGFLILFAFIGTFTYVNFVLVAPPYAVGMMTLGIVYLVFLPSIVTTPLAGRAVRRFGTRPTLRWSLAAAIAGLPLLLVGWLPAALAGLVLVGVGTFFAQATATGHVGRIAAHHRGAASGLYLASYFLGGLAGTAVLGIAFDRLGWTAAVVAIGLALGAAVLLGRWIEDRR